MKVVNLTTKLQTIVREKVLQTTSPLERFSEFEQGIYEHFRNFDNYVEGIMHIQKYHQHATNNLIFWSFHFIQRMKIISELTDRFFPIINGFYFFKINENLPNQKYLWNDPSQVHTL
jgi:hypothetical protein